MKTFTVENTVRRELFRVKADHATLGPVSRVAKLEGLSEGARAKLDKAAEEHGSLFVRISGIAYRIV